MKTICILTYERTGSGWLSDIFNGKDCVSVHEIFSEDPLLFILNLHKILTKIYNIDDFLLKTLYKIYNPDNFFVDSNTYSQIKKKILSNNIYDISLFDTLQKICYSNNLNLIFKLFPQHIKNLKDLYKVLDRVDLVIINYRKNVLDSFISLEIAKQTNVWYSQQNRIISKPKIIWNENLYKNYYDSIHNKILFFRNVLSKYKNSMILSYEDIHEEINDYNAKLEYINNKLYCMDISLDLNQLEIFKKQNNTIYSDIFENYEDFENSMLNIPQKIEI
jgi:LPS sulfotransferase NodH